MMQHSWFCKNEMIFAACASSRVFNIGPQIGYIFKIGENDAFLGLKGYGEFAAENRPAGWNTWLTFSISEAVPTTVTPTKHPVTK
jgi:hypothetical protein